jgi:hypothetical protein
MAEMPDGKWLPFEIDGAGRHTCEQTIAVSEGEPASSSLYSPVVAEEPFVAASSPRLDYEPMDTSCGLLSLRGLGVVIAVLLLLWLFFVR